jgi:hypothetical protein
MPRANRFYLPDAVWHITHRCHDQKFLLHGGGHGGGQVVFRAFD